MDTHLKETMLIDMIQSPNEVDQDLVTKFKDVAAFIQAKCPNNKTRQNSIEKLLHTFNMAKQSKHEIG